VAFADALERVLADPKAIERLKAGGSERVADFAPELIARRWLRFAASLS
jgi:glycosyltransferase involved in cell wall biosynthesis